MVLHLYPLYPVQNQLILKENFNIRQWNKVTLIFRELKSVKLISFEYKGNIFM